MLPSPDGYLHAKNLIYSLILSKDIIDNERILQSDWARDTTD